MQANDQGLIQENHQHLVSLQVSHPTLETIVSATRAAPYHLSTKLTGAGGGGCAITLIPDSYPLERLEELMSVLRNDGFEVFLTELGGRGVSRLVNSNKGSPKAEGQGEGGGLNAGDIKEGEGEDEGIVVPVREVLRRSNRGEGLAEWAEKGDWVSL